MFSFVPLALACLALADPADPLSALENALQAAIARAEPSVVAITRARNPEGEPTTAVRGHNPAGPPAAPLPFDVADLAHPDHLPMPGDFGSGVVIGPQQILTAFHVIKGASRIYVRAPGRQGFDAEIIAADPRSDLAVIAPRLLPNTPAPKLTPIPLGDADLLRKGSFLVVLGNPYNTARDGKASASWGILSNTTRRIVLTRDNESRESRQLFRYLPTLLQLDTKLNLGLSGGAVVNLKGELVGITTTGGNAEGFDAQAGYAIPLDALGRRIVTTLREGKEVEYGFLGIGLDNDRPNAVGSVEPGTPAAEGDLVPGDVILAVGDRPVPEEAGISLALSTAPVGQPIQLKVRRNGKVLDKTVFLSKYPVAGEVIATNRPEPWRGLRVDFTSMLAGTTLDFTALQAMAKGCVCVVEVKAGSPSAVAGLRKGQVITHVAGKSVRTPAEFARAVARLKGPVVLENRSGGNHGQVASSDAKPGGWPGQRHVVRVASHKRRQGGRGASPELPGRVGRLLSLRGPGHRNRRPGHPRS